MKSQQSNQYEPVAIVGMGCRWPGGAHDASSFWKFLCEKGDGWREFGYPRFSAQGFYHPNADRPGGFAMKGAFLMEEDARLFDHSFFGMTALEVETMDPSQRKLLEVAYEAIENAGETWDSISGSRTGVFVGNFCLDHWMIQSRDWDNPRSYAFVGAGTSILANRISYIFNLQGPSLTIDTACSSSMYALHLAVNAIRAGDCDSAIVASANWIGDPGVQIALDKLGALSASARCHTFDARAEGYARGEGYGAIYLKRPSLAISSGSPIRAMIRGTAMNSNGRTGGITRPSVRGQETVIREAYRNAGGLSFGDTTYFECHGTGTYVGDPIEMAAVGKVFAEYRVNDDPLLVGSVKNNVGHGEGASALASIMKVVLALERGAIPPIFNLETRNPNIDFEGARVHPVTEVTPWPACRLKRASINSFGYGGANAHCIIDHVNNVLPGYVAPGVYKATIDVTAETLRNGNRTNGAAKDRGYENLSNGTTNGKPDENPSNSTANGHRNGNLTNRSNNNHCIDGLIHSTTNGYEVGVSGHHHPVVQGPSLVAEFNVTSRHFVLLPFSAHNENSLKLNIDALSRVIDRLPLADVAYTLSSRRSRFAQRYCCVVDRNNVPVGNQLKLDTKPVRAPLQAANVGFIFTGQGAQWHGMGAELFDYRVFRTAIEYLDQVLGLLPNPPNWSLQSVLSGDCDRALIQTAEVSQAVCTAVQIGLVDLLASWSIRPVGVAGHSSGEIAAAYTAGRISAAEAIVAAYLRGQAVSKNDQKGAMLAVGLGHDEVETYVRGRENEVKVAAVNSPGSVTLSGEENTIDQLAAAMTDAGIFNRKLKTGGNAYHSHHMLPIGREYVAGLTEGIECIRALKRTPHYQQTLWISSVTPTKSTTMIEDFASYWRANLESPVRFSEAVSRLVDTQDVPIHVLVEIGPHSALKSPVEQILKAASKSLPYVSTLKRQENGQKAMVQLAGTLFCLNAAVDLAAVNSTDGPHEVLEHGCIRSDLPPYQYTYSGLNYHESRASKEYRYRKVLRHDLLGSKIVGTAKLRPQWRNVLRIKDVSWLGHHRLLPDAVLPGAAYMAMAIEAASRVHTEFSEPSKIKGYSLADLVIAKSLVVPEDDHGIEILTSMELVDVATASSPEWASFSISSVGRETGEWAEHCYGRVKIVVEGGDDDEEQQAVADAIPPGASQAVNSEAWYKKFAQIGLGYGPTFQPLSNIRVMDASNLAVATVDLHTTRTYIKGGESPYPLHPAALDGAIQLGLIACYGGKYAAASTAFVPVRLSRLYISSEIDRNAAEVCTVVARGEQRGIRGAHLDFHMVGNNSEILAQAEGLRCLSLPGAAKPIDKAFSSPFTRLVWKPDIRAMNNVQARAKYPPPAANVKQAPAWAVTNRLAHFVVFSIYERFGQLENGSDPSGDVGHFFRWVKRKGQNDHSSLMEEARRLATGGLLISKIEELAREASHIVEVKIAKLLHDNMDDILHERETGIDVILGADLLTPLYQSGLLMTGIYPQLHHILAGLAHSNPNARVLEIGGGTGGATRIAMKAFNNPNGIKAYREYTFTDISAGFLSGARESMADLNDMKFSVFDIEGDPVEQGYVEHDYDLIIACQVLHATPNMHRAMTNCRRLLKPGGKLVLVETNENFIVPGVVVGTFTGYWAGIPDGRVDAPFQSLPAWDRSLREAGFSGLDIVLDDFPEPHNTTSVILSTVPFNTPSNLLYSTVYVLHGSGKATLLVDEIVKTLRKRGTVVKTGTLDQAASIVPPNSCVITLFGEQHLLLKANDDELAILQYISRNSTRFIALTSNGLTKGQKPDAAVLSGLLHVLRSENPGSEYFSIDIDATDFDISIDQRADLSRSIVDFALGDRSATSSYNLDGNPMDYEFSWIEGCMWVSRHVPDAGFHSLHGINDPNMKPEILPLRSQGPLRATFESPGVLNSLCFKSYEEVLQPPQAGFIDVTIEAIGLDTGDLDRWTGRVDEDYLSSEYAGTVCAVSSTVGNLKVGDRVYGLGKGQFGNYTRVPAAMARKLLPSDDMVQMASIPMAYAMAIYALEYIAQLKSGKSVLIHSNLQAIGLATINLAVAKDANVFVLVETPEEGRFLIDELGMPATHVISSKASSTTLSRTSHMKHPRMFDTIISTVAGERLLSISGALKPLGQFIFMGRASDPAASVGKVEMLPQNVSFCSIDPAAILDSDLTLGAELMQAIDDRLRQGLIRPIQKIEVVDPAQVGSIISNVTKIIGKLVVNLTNPGSLIRIMPSPPKVHFDPDSCYVITGALGGLGQSLVRWMADRGAKHLVLLSRRNVSSVPGAQDLVKSLATRDIDVECITCDVSKKDLVLDVIQQIASKRPIKGIIHAAVSYLDLTFDKLSANRWNAGLSAKVEGTRNLHEAVQSMSLDFFVMTTSALSVYAFPTQAAYTAANNFQDAFARYRRRLGLPAATVSFSLIRDVSEVGSNEATINLFERNKGLMLDESQFLALLEPAFLNNRTSQKPNSQQWHGQEEDPLSAANLHTYLDPLSMVARKREEQPQLSTTLPRWYFDGRVSLIMRAFSDAQRQSTHSEESLDAGSKITAASVRREFGAAIKKGPAERTSTVSLVQASIMEAVAEMLFVDVEAIDPAKSVADLGVDSLIAAELRSWFLQALGTNISLLDLLDPNVSISTRAADITDKALDGTE